MCINSECLYVSVCVERDCSCKLAEHTVVDRSIYNQMASKMDIDMDELAEDKEVDDALACLNCLYKDACALACTARCSYSRHTVVDEAVMKYMVKELAELDEEMFRVFPYLRSYLEDSCVEARQCQEITIDNVKCGVGLDVDYDICFNEYEEDEAEDKEDLELLAGIYLKDIEI